MRFFPVIFLLVNLIVARDFSKIQTTATPIKENIYLLQGAGGNILLICQPGNTVLVDSQFEGLASKHEKTILRHCKEMPRYLINTHWHGDHTGGNIKLGLKADVLAHENVRQRLMSDQFRGDRKMEAKPKEAWPVITFQKNLQLYSGEVAFDLVHYENGHTDGDTVVYLPAQKVVHMGDLYFKDRFPFIDRDSMGSLSGYFQSVQKVIQALDDSYIIIPGHGSLSHLDELREWLNLLKESVEIIQNRRDEGMSDGKIISMGLPEKFKSMGSGFISTPRWMDTVLNEL